MNHPGKVPDRPIRDLPSPLFNSIDSHEIPPAFFLPCSELLIFKGGGGEAVEGSDGDRWMLPRLRNAEDDSPNGDHGTGECGVHRGA